jgi:hypothetical protein
MPIRIPAHVHDANADQDDGNNREDAQADPLTNGCAVLILVPVNRRGGQCEQ